MAGIPATNESRKACIHPAIETGIPLSTCWKSPSSIVCRPRNKNPTLRESMGFHLISWFISKIGKSTAMTTMPTATPMPNTRSGSKSPINRVSRELNSRS